MPVATSSILMNATNWFRVTATVITNIITYTDTNIDIDSTSSNEIRTILTSVLTTLSPTGRNLPTIHNATHTPRNWNPLLISPTRISLPKHPLQPSPPAPSPYAPSPHPTTRVASTPTRLTAQHLQPQLHHPHPYLHWFIQSNASLTDQHHRIQRTMQQMQQIHQRQPWHNPFTSTPMQSSFPLSIPSMLTSPHPYTDATANTIWPLQPYLHHHHRYHNIHTFANAICTRQPPP